MQALSNNKTDGFAFNGFTTCESTAWYQKCCFYTERNGAMPPSGEQMYWTDLIKIMVWWGDIGRVPSNSKSVGFAKNKDHGFMKFEIPSGNKSIGFTLQTARFCEEV